MVKKFLRGVNLSLLLLIIISTFSSCANEMNIFEGNNNIQINFSVSVPEWKNTDSLATTKTSRATPITDASLSTSNTFNLIADQNDGTGIYSILINKEAVSFTNSIWQTTPSHYYWSGIANKTVNFYAYYPTNISTNITHSAGSAPTLLYTVPSDASNQIDIITAINPNVSGSTATSTPLTFNHIFAAVKFAVGTSGLPSGTIKLITINGIKNSGTYTFGSGWTLGSTTSSFTVSPSTTINGTSGENIASDAFTLMMIPQSFTSATITLTYDTGTEYKQTISGNWAANNIYTYQLSKPVNIGDYYYDDGTWGTIAEHVNSTARPIAVIFSNTTSTTDMGNNWTHGYAMALKESASNSVWSTNVQWEMGEQNAKNTETLMKTDLDGYTHTKIIYTNHYSVLQNEYPAFYYAKNYSVSYPQSSSGWFLPSIGQLYYILSNLGFKTTSTSLIYWGFTFSGDASTCINNLNYYLNLLGISDITSFVPNILIWSSSEGEGNSNTLNSGVSTGVCVDNYLAFPFDHSKNVNPFNGGNYYHVRSAIAF